MNKRRNKKKSKISLIHIENNINNNVSLFTINNSEEQEPECSDSKLSIKEIINDFFKSSKPTSPKSYSYKYSRQKPTLTKKKVKTQKHKEKKEFKLKSSSKYYSYPLENDENGYFCTYIHNEFRTDTTRISLIVNTDIEDISQYTVRIKKRITDQLLLNATLYKNEVEIENLHFQDPNIIQKDSIKYKETART